MVHSRYTKSSQRTPESPQADKAKAKTRERREKDKKTMLSKALEKANTAVLLDNAQNFEGALEAYSDACRLLLQVMERTGGEEDKRKLDAIVSCVCLTEYNLLTLCSAKRILPGSRN